MHAEGYERTVYAEIVTPATSRRDQPAELVMYTDFKRILGITFSRRVWTEVSEHSATFFIGPELPSRGYLSSPRPADADFERQSDEGAPASA